MKAFFKVQSLGGNEQNRLKRLKEKVEKVLFRAALLLLNEWTDIPCSKWKIIKRLRILLQRWKQNNGSLKLGLSILWFFRGKQSGIFSLLLENCISILLNIEDCLGHSDINHPFSARLYCPGTLLGKNKTKGGLL